MGRENKKELVAALHRTQIMSAAERLFSEKGYAQTSIDDISGAAEYSRRTVYSYFESKDDILQHIVEKGLLTLKSEISQVIHNDESFVEKYFSICRAMRKYQTECPHSAGQVNEVHADKLANLSEVGKRILQLGTEINAMLASFLEQGQNDGIVRRELVPMLTVYVMWTSISSVIALSKSKGKYIAQEYRISEEEFADYGFRQILNSILTERI